MSFVYKQIVAMAIPKFSDIGKETKDLLSKDFPQGAVSIELKTAAPNGVNFTATGSHDNASGAIAGELKTKFTHAPSGVTITESFTNNNVLKTNAEVSNVFTKGLNFEADSVFLPSKGDHSAIVKSTYSHPLFNAGVSATVTSAPLLGADLSVTYQSFTAGADVGYRVHGDLEKYNFAVAMTQPDFKMALLVSNKLDTVEYRHYQAVNSQLLAGASAVYSRSKASVLLNLAAAYKIDSLSTVKVKVDSNGSGGFGYSQLLRPGVKLGLGAQIDFKNMDKNNHKLGLSLTVDC